jgi:hypothetical protein
MAREAQNRMKECFREAFGERCRLPLPPSAFFLVLAGLTDRFPHQASMHIGSHAPGITDEDVADVVARFMLTVMRLADREPAGPVNAAAPAATQT